MNSRFVNTVVDSNLGKKELWNHIKNLRFEYLMKNVDISCGSAKSIQGQDIQNITEKLSKIVGTQSSNNQIRKNVSKSDFQVEGEMFVTIISCPSVYERLYWKVIYGKRIS